jgi:type I restriction enzyme S subunit
MTLKPGYKQTEVGAIPSEWVLEYVEELAHITTGSRNTQDRVDEGLYPFFVRSQTIERINSYSFDGEAVLTAGDGVGTGKVFHYIDGKFDTHQRVYRISDFSARVNGYYFYLYFSSHFYSRIMQMTAKSSVDSVRREMIARMLIPLPTKAEQDAIAEALNDVDALIESLEQLVVKKRQIKKGAMQELLTGRKRLPGFSGEWKRSPFDSVLHRTNAKNHQIQTSEYQTSGRFPVVDQGKELVVAFSDEHEKRFACPEGGVIVFGDHTCIIKFVDFEFLVGADGTQILEAKPGQCIRFHAFQLQYKEIVPTGYNRHFKFLKERDFAVPPLREQAAIALTLSDIDSEIDALERKLAKARQIKQGMLQDLLTGRIRLV